MPNQLNDAISKIAESALEQENYLLQEAIKRKEGYIPSPMLIKKLGYWANTIGAKDFYWRGNLLISFLGVKIKNNKVVIEFKTWA